MATRSEFAQKLLSDLRLRKERMAASQSTSRSSRTAGGKYKHKHHTRAPVHYESLHWKTTLKQQNFGSKTVLRESVSTFKVVEVKNFLLKLIDPVLYYCFIVYAIILVLQAIAKAAVLTWFRKVHKVTEEDMTFFTCQALSWIYILYNIVEEWHILCICILSYLSFDFCLSASFKYL